MKILKLTKKHLSDPLALLLNIGAKDDKTNQVFPGKVYLNLKDYNVLKKTLTKELKIKLPYLNSRKIKSKVGLTLLNYGPVEVKHGIEQGYAVYIE